MDCDLKSTAPAHALAIVTITHKRSGVVRRMCLTLAARDAAASVLGNVP